MEDRYFDQQAARFAEKIYGGSKGAIRLAVLKADLLDILPSEPMRVLDVGAGMGHIALWLAEQGHHLTLLEPSAVMMAHAEQGFREAGATARFETTAWQQWEPEERYDLVICHAVLEWLAAPETIVPFLRRCTADEGWLSLAFYNRDALIYRNLLKGHFRKLRKNDFAGEGQSLTPQKPLDPHALETHLQNDWWIEQRSGIRVFHDYMPPEFQARTAMNELIEMELAYRRHPVFSGLGRYLHWLCRPRVT